MNKHDDKVLEEFGAALARIPEVVEAHLVTGDYDYLVKVAVAATEHYENFLRGGSIGAFAKAAGLEQLPWWRKVSRS